MLCMDRMKIFKNGFERKRAQKKKFIFYDSYISGLYPNGKRLPVDIYSQDYKRLFKGSKITAEQELPEGVSFFDIPKTQ